MISRIDLIIDLVDGLDVLDVGCAGHIPKPGNQNWLHGRLREKCSLVVGVDYSERNINYLRSLGYDQLYCSTVESFEYKSKFSNIVAGELLEHVGNAEQVLRALASMIKKDGRIIVSTPNVFCLMYSVYAAAKFPKTCENDEHTQWYCETTLTELARRAGLNVKLLKYGDDYVPEVTSKKYKIFWSLFRIIRVVLPKSMRWTTMVAVLEPSRE